MPRTGTEQGPAILQVFCPISKLWEFVCLWFTWNWQNALYSSNKSPIVLVDKGGHMESSLQLPSLQYYNHSINRPLDPIKSNCTLLCLSLCLPYQGSNLFYHKNSHQDIYISFCCFLLLFCTNRDIFKYYNRLPKVTVIFKI